MILSGPISLGFFFFADFRDEGLTDTVVEEPGSGTDTASDGRIGGLNEGVFISTACTTALSCAMGSLSFTETLSTTTSEAKGGGFLLLLLFVVVAFD